MDIFQTDDKMPGIYLHYPWCLQKCSYCDFFSVPMRHLTPAETKENNTLYINAIRKELSERSRLFTSGPAGSIYFGGGTASLLNPESIQILLDEIKKYFEIKNCEITVEGNPENFSGEYLLALNQIGVNRINSGFQSFSEKSLTDLKRYHRKEQYESALEALSTSPIKNWGGDLMYGIPGQSEEDFYRDLNDLMGYDPKHLSLYALTVEENTAFAASVRKKEMSEPDDLIQQKILLNLNEYLIEKNFIQYEVSNFAKRNYICRHNLNYWLYRPYVGLGPGAHGFNGEIRYANPRNIEKWMENPAGAERIKIDPANEIPLMILRLTVPISINYIFFLAEKFIPEFKNKTGRVRILELLRKWEKRGYGKINIKKETAAMPDMKTGESLGTGKAGDIFKKTADDSFFTWSRTGLQFLDERITEFSVCLENGG